MAQTARRNYEYRGSAAPKRTPERHNRPDVRVIPGRKSSNPALQGLSSGAISFFRFAMVALVIFAIIGCGRVMFSAATVENLQDINRLESALAAEQATSQELEIQHSVLSQPSRIEKKAKALGMSSPDKVKYITVSLKTPVSVNVDGSISLSRTLSNIESAARAKSK